MNLNEMITFVREHADTDVSDAPTSSLTVYARAAFNDIRRRTSRWTDNTASDTLTTAASTASYTLSDTGAFTSANIEYVTNVVGDDGPLKYLPYESLLQLQDGTPVTGSQADYFSIQNDVLYLYPTPNSVVTYSVTGYREFADWPNNGASNEPDLPREFDEAICWFMLSRYYRAQEDLELAQIYEADFERAVGRQLAGMLRSNAVRYRVLGGGRPGLMSYGDWVRRNTEG